MKKIIKTEDFPDVIVETLQDFSKRIYRKSGGRIDNKRYLVDHREDFLQRKNPDGTDNQEFLKVYGHK